MKQAILKTGGMLASKVGIDADRVGVSMLPKGEFAFIVAREGTGSGATSQLFYPLAGLTNLANSLAASMGLHLLGPLPTAQPAQLPSRPIETLLEPEGLIPA